jgi:hypothetical protein
MASPDEQIYEVLTRGRAEQDPSTAVLVGSRAVLERISETNAGRGSDTDVVRSRRC